MGLANRRYASFSKARRPVRRYASHGPSYPVGASPKPQATFGAGASHMAKTAKRNKPVTVSFRLTDEDLTAVREAAEAAGLSPGQYARARTLGHVVMSRVDMTAINELRRQGGLLKHIALERQLPLSSIELALDAVVDAIHKLARSAL